MEQLTAHTLGEATLVTHHCTHITVFEVLMSLGSSRPAEGIRAQSCSPAGMWHIAQEPGLSSFSKPRLRSTSPHWPFPKSEARATLLGEAGLQSERLAQLERFVRSFCCKMSIALILKSLNSSPVII